MTNYFGIVVAAGTGARYGADRPKQYSALCHKLVIAHSIEALLALPALRHLVVVLHKNDTHWNTLPYQDHPRISAIEGGARREDSVLCGLNALTKKAAPDDWVMVHDAARPYIPFHDLKHLIAATQEHPTGGILAAPLVDTLKYSTDGKTIQNTVPRNGLFRALTPQCCRYQKLKAALIQAKSQHIPVTDEAMALELMGESLLLVPGDPKNIKITYPEDLALLEQVMCSPSSALLKEAF